jgi:hypothetical protein
MDGVFSVSKGQVAILNVLFVIVWIVGIFAFVRFMGWLQNTFRSVGRPPSRVHVDKSRITLRGDDKRPASLNWSKLSAVYLRTTSSGPMAPDAFYELVGDGKVLSIPCNSDGANELLRTLQDLPGFDSMATIAAMGVGTDSRRVVWKRSGHKRTTKKRSRKRR